MNENQRLAVTLASHLNTVPYKDLRGMATRLGVRQRPQQQKVDWIAPIVAGWQQAGQPQQWWSALSPTALAALHRLLAAHQIPATLFWATYGVVRQVTAQQHWTPPPWQAPANASEELYYSGLLASADGLPLTRTQWLTVPVDLRAWLGAADKGDRERGRQGDRGTRRPRGCPGDKVTGRPARSRRKAYHVRRPAGIILSAVAAAV